MIILKHSTKSRILPFKCFANTLLETSLRHKPHLTKSRVLSFKFYINTNIYYHDNITTLD